MSKRLLAGIVAVVSSLLSLSADAAPAPGSAASYPGAVTYPGLERYVDIRAFFSVLMRGTPDKGAQFELDGANYSSVSQADKEGTWAVSYADVSTMPGPPYDSKAQSAVIQKQSLAYIEKIHGEMQSLKAHEKFGYQFREFEGRVEAGAGGGKIFRINSYLAGRRMFILSIVGKEAWVRSPQADAFLASFEVPGMAAVPKLNVNKK